MSEYEKITVDGKQRAAHDVIMEHILGRPLTEDEVVHHKNGDKRDNRTENLEVMTRSEHTARHKRGGSFAPETLGKMSRSHTGIKNAQRKLTDEQVRAIAQRLLEGESLSALGKEYEVSPKTIAAIRDGRRYREVTETIPGFESLQEENRKKPAAGRGVQKLNYRELAEIRARLMNGEAMHAIAKRFGIATSAIADIRDGRTYSYVPWPVEEERCLLTENMTTIVSALLDLPLSEIKNEDLALRKDYHIWPTFQAVIALKMVRRAAAGDRELGIFLFSMSRHAGEIGELIREKSIVMEYFGSAERTVKSEE